MFKTLRLPYKLSLSPSLPDPTPQENLVAGSIWEYAVFPLFLIEIFFRENRMIQYCVKDSEVERVKSADHNSQIENESCFSSRNLQFMIN